MVEEGMKNASTNMDDPIQYIEDGKVPVLTAVLATLSIMVVVAIALYVCYRRKLLCFQTKQIHDDHIKYFAASGDETVVAIEQEKEKSAENDTPLLPHYEGECH